MVITLAEYAKLHGRSLAAVRQKAYRGGFTTAHRIGRDWFISDAEPMVDNRRKLTDEDAPTGPDGLTASKRHRDTKLSWAMQLSGWKQYPDTCHAIFANIPAEMLDRYTAAQLAEIADLTKKVYDKGVAYGREHPEY